MNKEAINNVHKSHGEFDLGSGLGSLLICQQVSGSNIIPLHLIIKPKHEPWADGEKKEMS